MDEAEKRRVTLFEDPKSQGEEESGEEPKNFEVDAKKGGINLIKQRAAKTWAGERPRGERKT